MKHLNGGIRLKKKTIVIASISAFAIMLLGYIGGGMYYQDHFLPNTTMGTLDLSGDTVAEANRKIAKNLHAKNIEIVENGNTLATFTPAQLEASVDGESFLKEEKTKQGGWKWPIAFFQDSELALSNEAVTYNQEALQSLVDSLSLESGERAVPQNAQVKSEGDTFVIEKEVLGTAVDRAKLEQNLVASMTDGKSEVKIEEAYQQPTLTSESPELKTALEKLSDLADTVITYQISGAEEVVPKEKIVTWLKVDGEGNPTVDQAAAKEYLDTLHDKYATYEKTRSFKSTNRGTVEVPPGEYGWSIATEAESEKLVNYLLAGEDVDVQPTVLGSGYHEDGTDIGGTYIEVDLQAQTMYYYKDGKKVFETPIVSGHQQTPTPIGVFYAWDKVEDTKLVGYNPRREADYATPVEYWVPLNWDGIGIHDANWQASFASNQWVANGSNGCINTPPGAMAELFSMLEVGTPVVLF